MVEMLLANDTGKQVLVIDIPTPPMRHPTYDMTVFWIR
jgi:hypothetical protein